MKAAALRDRLDRLARAGEKLRARPAAETLDSLARVLDAWRDPGSRWRSELAAELPVAGGFSRPTVERGLALALEEWSGEALRALVEDELGGAEAAHGFDTTAVVLAGAIPMPSLLSLLAPLALRSPVLAKCASRDVVTPPLVTASVAEIDPLLGDCLEVVAFPSNDGEAMAALCEADCVLATGSDETIAAIRTRVAPPRRLVAHGHRLSLAAVGALGGDAVARAADGVALDAALWDQQGCLSPIAVFVSGDADAFAEALAEALARLERELPRGAVDPRGAAAIQHERSDAELRGAASPGVRVLASRGTAWTVVREADATPRPSPLHRFLRVHPVRDASALLDALAPYAAHLAGVALAGFEAERPRLDQALLALGASRVCAPGALQAPPLSWRREGLPVLGSLSRVPESGRDV
jgi:acyl-CoA reductase-like NAD-dependent aldehyde dehydrogenase